MSPAAQRRPAQARTSRVSRILASVAIPLSIVPLVGAGFLYVRRDAAVAPAVARSTVCHPMPAPPVWDPVGMRTAPHPGAVPVIVYHGVTLERRSPDGDTVTREQLARQLVDLRASGYEAISAATYLRFAAGHPVRLPSHPILIAFDDGDASSYCAADTVLRRTRLQAVMFARRDTGCTSCLTAAQLHRMRADGRWDIIQESDSPFARRGRRGYGDRFEVRSATTAADLLRWLSAGARRAQGAAPAAHGAVGE